MKIRFLKKFLSLGNKGILLMEALLAVVILSVGIVAIIQSLLSSLRSVVFHGNYTQAALLTDNKMFDLLEKRGVNDSTAESDHFPAPFDNFDYQVEAVPEEQNPAIEQVSVNISWGSKKGKNFKATTYLFAAMEEKKQ